MSGKKTPTGKKTVLKKPLPYKKKPSDIPPSLKSSNPDDFLYGKHAVDAALRNPKRKISALIVSPAKQAEYQHMAEKGGYKVFALKTQTITKLLPDGAVHQGIAVLTMPLSPPERFIKPKAQKDLVLMLDGVTDPHNVGAILRVCAAFECKTLILQDRYAPPMNGVLAKAAAGALESVDIFRVSALHDALKGFKKSGYQIYGADGSATVQLQEVEFSPKSVIVMGSEGEGMRPQIQKTCNTVFSITMSKAMESLNVSVAAAIALYATRFQG